MITVTRDGLDPTRLLVTHAATFYLDAVLKDTLMDELAKMIRAQARKDLKSNPEVKKAVAEAAFKKLLAMLDIEEKQEVAEESNESTGTSKANDNGQSVSEDRSSVSK